MLHTYSSSNYSSGSLFAMFVWNWVFVAWYCGRVGVYEMEMGRVSVYEREMGREGAYKREKGMEWERRKNG